MPDALQLLRSQHDEVKEIFKKFSNADDAGTRKSLAQQAIMQLEVHSKIEEEFFYPAVRAEGDTTSMMNEAEEEHHLADLLMDELRAMPATDSHFEAKFEVLAESVRHHMEEEESEIFPKAAELGPDKLNAIGDRMERRIPALMQEAQKPRRSTARPRASSRHAAKPRAGATRTRTTSARGAAATKAKRTTAGTRAAGTRTSTTRASGTRTTTGKRGASTRATSTARTTRASSSKPRTGSTTRVRATSAGAATGARRTATGRTSNGRTPVAAHASSSRPSTARTTGVRTTAASRSRSTPATPRRSPATSARGRSTSRK